MKSFNDIQNMDWNYNIVSCVKLCMESFFHILCNNCLVVCKQWTILSFSHI